MYKHLFRTVLGVVGAFGILSLGMVNAADLTITYDLSGGYRVEDGTTGYKEVVFTTDANGMVGTTSRRTPSRGDECEEDGEMKKCMFDGWYLENGARWTGYADSDMRVYAKWLPFEDITLTLSGTTFTIMDRNLGATASGTGCTVGDATCGYHFQWGNNYGFKPCSDSNYCNTFPNGENPILAKATDREGHTSTYYNGIWRIGYAEWNGGAKENDNLWGGSKTSNAEVDRQGPCPDGYHVPDTLEWNAVGTLLKVGSNLYTVRDTLNLPFAGYRNFAPNSNYINNNYVTAIGSSAAYWSSTPSHYTSAYHLNVSAGIGPSGMSRQLSRQRSYGYSVRCFKNSSPQILTFTAGNEVLTIKDFRWWEPITKSHAPDAPERENAEFIGWFADSSNEAFVFGTSAYISQDTILNAGYKCNLGYVENEKGTACEKIRVEFDANGGFFGDENVKIIESSMENNSESTVKYSHTPNIDDEGNKKSDYLIGLNMNEVVRITGAKNLHVKINCDFRGRSYSSMGGFYGSILMWTGNYPDYTTQSYLSTSIANLPTLGENCRYEYDIEGDTVTFACSTESDSSSTRGDRYGYYAIIEGTGVHVEYPDGAFDNIPDPTREGHNFKGWYLSGGAEFDTGNVSTGEVTHVYAKWECAQGYVDKQGQCVKEETKPSGGSSGGGGGGGGGSSSSCKNLPTNAVANNSSKPSSNTNYYYSTNTSKVCTFQCKSGYTRNEEKETCDKTSDSQTTSTGTTVKEPEASTGNNTKVETGNNTEIQTGSIVDSSDQVPQENNNTQDSTINNTQQQNSSTTSSTYSTEFQEAYEFAHENGITTKNTIEAAQMNGKLTRIAMAKMLSQYAMNVLGQEPSEVEVPKFNDVTDKQNSDYDDGVTLAYQLGIMGQNMPNNNFRPNDEVTRAEFATALSRMAYGTSDGEYKGTAKYYIHHMEKLVKEGIITNDDPNMKELRGYVMIMLMRSTK